MFQTDSKVFLPRLRRRLPSTAAVPRVARKLQIYSCFRLRHWDLQVEENQLLWCNEQARQVGSAVGTKTGALGGIGALSYELDQLIEQTREQQQPEVRVDISSGLCECGNG